MRYVCKDPLILAVVLGVVGSGIYVAAQRAVTARQHADEAKARQLGDVSLLVPTTLRDMNTILGPPESVVVPIAQQGHVITRHANVRKVTWDAGLVVALFDAPESGGPAHVIPETAPPTAVEVRAPFLGTLDGVRLGEPCRDLRAQFTPPATGSATLDCGGVPDAVPNAFTVFDSAPSTRRSTASR
jgi:hypothetical protein